MANCVRVAGNLANLPSVFSGRGKVPRFTSQRGWTGWCTKFGTNITPSSTHPTVYLPMLWFKYVAPSGNEGGAKTRGSKIEATFRTF